MNTSKEVLRELVLKYNIPQHILEPLRLLDKRDTPMKPLKYEYGGYQCPNCKWLDVQLYNSDGSEKYLNYCDSCGQRLDWSE